MNNPGFTTHFKNHQLVQVLVLSPWFCQLGSKLTKFAISGQPEVKGTMSCAFGSKYPPVSLSFAVELLFLVPAPHFYNADPVNSRLRMVYLF
jgi:hypothetical protein